MAHWTITNGVYSLENRTATEALLLDLERQIWASVTGRLNFIILQAAGRPTNIEFGGFLPDEEAYALIKRYNSCHFRLLWCSLQNLLKMSYFCNDNIDKREHLHRLFMGHALKCCRRPGSETKMRALSPFPLKEDCGGVGIDMTGRCPPVIFPRSWELLIFTRLFRRSDRSGQFWGISSEVIKTTWHWRFSGSWQTYLHPNVSFT